MQFCLLYARYARAGKRKTRRPHPLLYSNARPFLFPLQNANHPPSLHTPPIHQRKEKRKREKKNKISIPSILLTIPHTPPNPPLKLLPILPPQLPRLNIRRRLIIRTPQHTNDTQQNTLGSLNRTPPFRRTLIPKLILSSGVQNRNTHDAILVDVGVENGS